MDKDVGILKDLVITLDDATECFWAISTRTTRPYLKSLLERVAVLHTATANDLAGRIAERGITPSRKGSLSAPLRRAYSDWRAVASNDIEVKYTVQAEALENRILRCLRAAITHVRDDDVRASLQEYMGETENNHTSIGHLRSALQSHASRLKLQPISAVRLSISSPRRAPVAMGRAMADSHFGLS